MANRFRLPGSFVAVVIALCIVSAACTNPSEAVPVTTSVSTSTTTSAPTEVTLAPRPPASVPTEPTEPQDQLVDAIVVLPSDDLRAIVAGSAEGTTFALAEGVHRGGTVEPKDGMTFIGQPGATLNGAVVLGGFVAGDGVWRLEGITIASAGPGECIEGYEGCRWSQDVFVDDAMLWQVTSRQDLVGGSWLWEEGSIVLADDPSGRKVELSVTQHAFVGAANDVTIRDLRIEKYATPAQQGAIHAQSLVTGDRSQHWIITDVEVSGSHGAGIRTGDYTTVSRVYAHHNGQMGVSVSGGTGVVLEASELAFNNIAGFDWGWEAGGMKATRTSGLVVRGNYSHDNDGPGLWTDIDARDTLYENNRVVANTGPGIFHEISFAATIRNNTVEGNGFGKPEWLWGAGILIAASRDVKIYENSVIKNADGIAGIQQDRGEGEYGPYLLAELDIRNNTIEMLEGQTGVVNDTSAGEVFADRGIVFTANTYIGAAGQRFAWDDKSLDRAGWLATGQDVGADWK